VIKAKIVAAENIDEAIEEFVTSPADNTLVGQIGSVFGEKDTVQLAKMKLDEKSSHYFSELQYCL
jgi:hypothetical protein